MKLELTIIIPCYNCADTLEEAVESCFKQNLTSFEVVLVDDGSSDRTREVMHSLAKKHSEVKVFFHEKNQGGGATRNTAVKHAEADIIFCLDSDDILPDGSLSTMLSFMKEKNCDAVGVHKSIKFRGANKNDVIRVDTFGHVGEKIPFEALLQKNGVLCSLYSTFMHTKKAFEIAGGYPVEHGFDTQGFAWRFLTCGLDAYTCPEASYLHRIEYKDSYYIREANAGKINYNWQDLLSEYLPLFNEETRQFILTFNCTDASRNLFEEFKERNSVFVDNYKELIGLHFKREKRVFQNRKYISRSSFLGIIMRIKYKLKRLFIHNENS